MMSKISRDTVFEILIMVEKYLRYLYIYTYIYVFLENLS